MHQHRCVQEGRVRVASAEGWPGARRVQSRDGGKRSNRRWWRTAKKLTRAHGRCGRCGRFLCTSRSRCWVAWVPLPCRVEHHSHHPGGAPPSGFAPAQLSAVTPGDPLPVPAGCLVTGAYGPAHAVGSPPLVCLRWGCATTIQVQLEGQHHSSQWQRPCRVRAASLQLTKSPPSLHSVSCVLKTGLASSARTRPCPCPGPAAQSNSPTPARALCAPLKVLRSTCLFSTHSTRYTYMAFGAESRPLEIRPQHSSHQSFLDGPST